MKKLLRILVAVAVFACGGAMLLYSTSKAITVKADGPVGSNVMNVFYSDNYLINSYVDLGEYWDKTDEFAPIEFDEYENSSGFYGAIVGKTGTVTLSFEDQQQVFIFARVSFHGPKALSDNIEDLTFTAIPGCEWTWEQLFGMGRRGDITIPYTNAGIYLVEIETSDGIDDYINHYVFVARNEVPDLRAHFERSPYADERAAEIIYYSNRLNSSSNLPLSYRTKISNNTSISGTQGEFGVKVLNSAKQEVDFLNCIYLASTETATDEMPYLDTLYFNIAQGKRIINGTYTIVFYVDFTNIGIDPDGGSKILLPAEQKVQITATIIFKNAPKGWEFPIWQLLLCVAIVGVIGGGWYISNWLVQYTQVQNSVRLERIQQERNKAEHEKLQQLRTQMAETESKNPTKKSTEKSTKKPRIT